MTTEAEVRVERPRGDASLGRIIRLAGPLVLSSIVVMGSQLVVTGMVGRMGGSALYVRSVYAPIAFLLVALTTGLAVTLQVVVARAVGRGDEPAISPSMGSMARLGVVSAALVGGVLVALAGVLAGLVAVPPEEVAPFRHFLIAMAAANLLGLLGELCSAVLRGTGRGSASALLTAVFVGLNLGIVSVLGLGLGAGLMAVPIGSAVAGTVELVLGLAFLVRRKVVDLRALTGWRPEVPHLVLAIGFPVGASYLLLFVVNLMLLKVVSPGGENAVAGFNVGYTLQTFVIVPAVGFGSAIAVLMNQHLGSGARDQAAAVLRRGLLLVAACYAVVTAVLLIAGRTLVGLLSSNPAVVAEADRFLHTVGPTFGCTGLILAALTVLEQVGHGPLAVTMNVTYFAAIIAAGWWFVGSSHDLHPLYLTMAIAAVSSLFTGLPYAWWVAVRPQPKPVRS
jgi:Na+-driven multidrug efflux pump